MFEASRKRKKKFYGGGPEKKSKYALNLTAGFKGFLITHNGPPKFCIREAYNILDEFAPDKPPPAESLDSNKESDDFESELKKDVEKAQNESREKEFQVVETGVTGCVFIKTIKSNPDEIMDKIIQKIIDTGRCRTRKILRMLPIQITCKAYLDDIKKAASPLFDACFKGEAKTYAIVVNRRNNSSVLRDELIQSLGLMIRDRSPFHSANLRSPELAVLVEILKGVCCLSVLRDYNRHRKYNLVELGLSLQQGRTEGETGTSQNNKHQDPVNQIASNGADPLKGSDVKQQENSSEPDSGKGVIAESSPDKTPSKKSDKIVKQIDETNGKSIESNN